MILIGREGTTPSESVIRFPAVGTSLRGNSVGVSSLLSGSPTIPDALYVCLFFFSSSSLLPLRFDLYIYTYICICLSTFLLLSLGFMNWVLLCFGADHVSMFVLMKI